MQQGGKKRLQKSPKIKKIICSHYNIYKLNILYVILIGYYIKTTDYTMPSNLAYFLTF